MAEKIGWYLGFNFKLCLVLIFPLILIPLLFIDQGSEKKFKCIYTVILTIGYSLIQAFPMEIAFLLPVVLFPVLGILDTGIVAEQYMTDTAMMLIGTTCIGLAMENSLLQNRLIYKLLLFTGSSPARILLGIILAAALLSNVLSLAVVITMLVPTVISINAEIIRAKELEDTDISSNMGSASGRIPLEILPPRKKAIDFIENMADSATDDEPTPTPRKNKVDTIKFKNALFLAILYGVVIGSKLIIYGNQVTLLYSQILQSRGSFDKSQLNFLSWFLFNLPISLLLLLVAWGVIVVLYLRSPKKELNADKSMKEESSRNIMTSMLRKKHEMLGSMTTRETMVVLFFVFAFILWFTREPGFIEGWSNLIPVKIGDSTPAVFIAILLLVLPYRWPKWKEPYDTFITWKYFQNRMPWGALIIMGGGIALSEGIVKSGLSDWIGEQLTFLESLSKEMILILLLLISSVGTEFVNGKACLLILHPIMDSLSQKMGLNPLYFGIPTVASCGCGFMLPTSSTYCALLFSLAEGDLKMMDMIKYGLIMNIIYALALFLMNITWGEFVFSYSEYVSNTTWPA